MSLKIPLISRFICKPIARLYKSIVDAVYTKYRTLERMIYWGWNLRDSYDWDYYQLERIMLLKLKRIHKECTKRGHLLWNQCERPAIDHEDRAEWKSMQSLELAILLLSRMTTRSDLRYAENSHKKHNEKWGELQSNLFDPSPEDRTPEGHLTYRSWRLNAVTEEEQAQERDEYRKLMSLDENIFMRDRRYFYEILNKYGRLWWD